ncbi:hypothetical protein K402DRAFT_400407 [Aulographum hederae CBS 113979]|uniref:Rhodopsin domain-containing protein n=1 Tax=Aulographum hederae CBS 113979 TaxID=1176131 RepID=A0A6G1HF57_9PEZI|nr:hypothetical protein K402DRAFT_400407 [Aulographum hederae CBS 113979]
MSSSDAAYRFETLDENDRSSHLWVLAIICLAFTSFSLIARFMIRKTTHGFDFNADDYTLFGAHIFMIIQFIMIAVSLVDGLGKDASIAKDQPIMADFFYTNQILFVVTLYIAKCSMILLLGRLFSKQLMAFWISFIVVGVAAVLAITAKCWPDHIYQQDYNDKCDNAWYRWLAVILLDIISEVVILGLSLYYVRDVQMERKPKVKVMLSFASRILVIAAAIVFLWTESTVAFSTTRNPGTSIILPTLLQQIELCLCIATATVIPCIRLLFRAADGPSRGHPAPSNGYEYKYGSARSPGHSRTARSGPNNRSAVNGNGVNLSLASGDHDGSEGNKNRQTVGGVSVRRSFSMRSETRNSSGETMTGWGRIQGIDEVEDPVYGINGATGEKGDIVERGSATSAGSQRAIVRPQMEMRGDHAV